ncbi:MAG: hypothetical protein O7E52_23245 [Candidatus Poribacteria bacterium]|nr:hypothetical protein [Candidatus Poribacteria bacterium]
MLVTTDMEAKMAIILNDYDARGGVPESSDRRKSCKGFCQSNQGLAQRKRRKHKIVAQQMLTLLSQLAHNLIIWLKGWMTESLQQTPAENSADSHSLSEPLKLAIKTISSYGIKRFVRQILGLGGKVILKGNQVKRLILHSSYPLIDRIITALESLLRPYQIRIGVGRT